MKKFKKAFTLVELVIVIAVIAILAAVLIPTFSSIISKANESVDTQFVTNLNKQLKIHMAENKIENENDLWNFLDGLYGEKVNETLTPKSSKSGNHFWYNTQTNTVQYGTLEDIYNPNFGKLSKKTFNNNSLRIFNNKYYLLDKGGSDIAKVINKFENMTDGADYLSAINAVDSLDSKSEFFKEELQSKLRKSVIVTDNGSFRYNNQESSDASIICFAPGIETITGKLYVFDIVKKTVSSPEYTSETNPLAFNVTEVLLPSTVKSVNRGSLYFSNTNVLISGSFSTVEEAKKIFKVYSSNGKVKLGDKIGYFNDEGNIVVDGVDITLDYDKTIDSFEILYDDKNTTPGVDKDYLSGKNILYVSYNIGTVQLGLSDSLSNNMVNWAYEIDTNEPIQGYKLVESKGNGLFEIFTPDLGKPASVTVTATLRNDPTVSDTIKIYIIRPNTTSIDYNSNTIQGTSTNEIELVFEGENYDFLISNLVAIYNPTGVVENEEVKLTMNDNDYFTFNKASNDTWVLSLKKSDTYTDVTVTLTATVGDILTQEYNFKLVDNSSKSFEKKFIVDKEGEENDVRVGATYLYRIGNKNAITLADLFINSKPSNNIALEIYDLTASSIGNTLIGSDTSFTATINGTVSAQADLSKESWSTTTIKFNGTGIAKIKIGNKVEDSFNGYEEIIVEVVDGKNVRSYGELSSSGNSVLLNDIEMSSNGSYSLSNGTLFGNGYTFDVSKGETSGTGTISGNYLIYLGNSNLDNINVVGAVYTDFSITSGNEYNRPVVLTDGTCGIYNSCISNAAAPVRAYKGDLTLENTILKGGSFANLDIRGGNINIKNLTTINQVDGNDAASNGTVIVGLGIVVWYEGPNGSEKIKINGLKQYNYISSSQKNNGIDIAKQFFDKLFSIDSTFVKTNGSEKWVNTGIISLYENIGENNISTPSGYSWSNVSYSTHNGNLCTQPASSYSVPPISSPNYEPTEQYAIEPEFSVEYPKTSSNKNYLEATSTCNNYCYYDTTTNTILVGVEKDSSILFNTNILSAYKGTNSLAVSASINGTSCGSTYNFTTAGDYKITYTYVDPYNYKLGQNGMETYEVTYTQEVNVKVIIIDKTIASATFDFNGKGSQFVTVGNEIYIMPADTSGAATKTVNGTTIYCPTIYVKYSYDGGALTDTNSSTTINTTNGKTTYAYLPVFDEIITISDNGNVYNSNTTSLPNGLEVIESEMKTALIWNSGDTPSVETVVMKHNNINKLYYKSVGIEGKDRDKCNYYVQYKYTDEAGNIYNYFVYYKLPKISNSVCVTSDTLVTLSDGSQVEVQNLKGNEQLLVWDYVTGTYTSSKIAYIVNHNTDDVEQEVTKLKFSDGSYVEIIGEHGFYSVDLNKWIYLTSDNVEQYLGNKFVTSNVSDSNLWNEITLVDYETYNKVTGVYEVVTYGNLSCYTNGILSVSGYTGGLLDIFEVNTETMTFDLELMQQDIETYGLFSYEDFKDLVPEQVFDMYNAKYLKVAIGKGLMTWDDIYKLIDIYESNNIVPLA